MSALATVIRESFDVKFTAKIDVLKRLFYDTIADFDIESAKCLHTFLNKHL